jgi:phosphatidate cytidylyltransferase
LSPAIDFAIPITISAMNLAPEVQTTILMMFAGLVIASVLSIVLVKWKPQKDFSELRSRIRTWWVIVGIFSGALWWSTSTVVAFFGFTSFLALKEFLSMTPTRRADRRVLFYAYLSIPIQYYFAASGWYGMFIVFVPVLMFIWLPTRMWMMGQTDGFLRAAGSLHWALMLTVFSLSHAAFLLKIVPSDTARCIAVFPSERGEISPGPGLLLLVVLLTQLNDIFQYLWGKSIGGPKVAPLVSPGKTYAGLVGGIITTVAFATWLGPQLTMLDWPRSLIAGAIIGLGGFAGDLCMSALKRDLKIKDFGATLPGHGGVLDRVDSLIFTAPLFFHFVYYCYG